MQVVGQNAFFVVSEYWSLCVCGDNLEPIRKYHRKNRNTTARLWHNRHRLCLVVVISCGPFVGCSHFLQAFGWPLAPTDICHVMSWSARAIVRWPAQWASIGRTSSLHTHTHSDGMGPR